MALLLAIVGAAVVADVYFDNHPAELEKIQAGSEKQSNEPGTVYLISQTGSPTVKSSVQKTQNRNLRVESHDKFLRKYHHLRNYQVLKAETATQTTPLILSYHYLVFQNHLFALPDEDPLIS